MEEMVSWFSEQGRAKGLDSVAARIFAEEQARYFSGESPAGKELRRASIEELLHGTLDDCGIVCFSEDYGQPLLWGHYANGHRGICIGYSTQRLQEAGVELIQVQYPPQRPVINPFRSRSLPSPADGHEMIGKKSPEWAYEKEWRAFLHHDRFKKWEAEGGSRELALPTEIVGVVILGAKSPQQCEGLARRWCSGGRSKIPLLRAALSSTDYAVEVAGLDDVVSQGIRRVE